MLFPDYATAFSLSKVKMACFSTFEMQQQANKIDKNCSHNGSYLKIGVLSVTPVA